MQQFKAIWYGTEYLNESISTSLLTNAIQRFTLEQYDFFILEPQPPLQQSIYLQTASPNEQGIMPVEIRFEYPNGSFRHYAHTTTDKQEVIDYFTNYWQGNVPDISQWEDITETLC